MSAETLTRSFQACQLVLIGPGRWGHALISAFSEKERPTFFIHSSSTPKDWEYAFKNNKPLVIIATPFKEVHRVLRQLKNKELLGVVNASKGIDRKSLLTFSSLAHKILRCPFATLSGPTFAQELMQKKPTACVVAGNNRKFASTFSNFFSTSYFRIYSNSDPRGVEACGAMKNVLAIACGISDGLKLGQNARAALLTRGLREMSSVVKILGGKPSTVYGLAGVGDLWLTATGNLSRNRKLGLYLAEGLSVSEALNKLEGPAEGFYTVQQVVVLAKQNGLDLPISNEVDKICRGRQRPRSALQELMSRELRAEDSDLDSSFG